MTMTLIERLETEANRAINELLRNPTDHERAAAKSLVMRGAEVTLQYIKDIGLVGIPTGWR